MLKLLQIWPVGVPSIWPPCPFDISASFFFFFFLFGVLPCFLAQRDILGSCSTFCGPILGTQTLLQRILVLFSGGWYLETKIWETLVCHHRAHPSFLSSYICNAFFSDRKLAPIILLKKTRQQAPNGVTYAKPHITKLRLNLITISACPTNFS